MIFIYLYIRYPFRKLLDFKVNNFLLIFDSISQSYTFKIMILMSAMIMNISSKLCEQIELLSHLPMAIAVFATDGKILFLNELFAKTYHLNVKKMLYKNILNFSKDAYCTIQSNIESFRSGQNIEPYEFVLHEQHYWVTVKENYDKNHNIESILVCKSNITNLKYHEKQLLSANQELKHISEIDHLTGLFNRRVFDTLFKQYRQDIRLNNLKELCVLMIDIDNFKLLNDSHGHEIGDRVLQCLSQALSDLIQPQQGQVLCRFGGEEFAILLPNFSLQQGCEFAEKCRQATLHCQKPAEVSASLQLSISIGLSHSSQTKCVDDLIRLADQALYHAKRDLKNCIYYPTGNKMQRYHA